MEPMDFDIDMGEQSVKYGHKMLSEFSMSGRDNRLDLSDMDIDPGSPGQDLCSVRSSTSFEFISKGLGCVLSLNMTNDVNIGETHLNGEKHGLPLPSTPSQDFKRLPSAGHDINNAWQPATITALGAVSFRKCKTGYGIPDGETEFAHFPDPVTGGSVRKRQSTGNSSAADRIVKQKSMDSLGLNHQNNLASQSHQKLTSTMSSKGMPKRNPSCLGFILLVILTAISMYFIVTFYTIYKREKCQVSRDFNKRILEMELETNVFGQHLAARIVPDKIEEYFSKLHSSSLSQQATASLPGDLLKCKPLVLSFDGWTGVGKNYISRFISETFQHSKILNFIIPLNFPHKSFEDDYRQQIQQWILGNFTHCMVNIIVLDEMDKALPGVIEGLTEAINELTQPCSSAGSTIFLLLSNTHAIDINRSVLKFLLDSPTNKREQLSQEDFSSIFASELNVWYSTLVREHLIDALVPFLPLEREHVIQCIKRDLVSKRFSTDAVTVNRVLQELSFSSFGDIDLSQTGCKRVADKVDLVMFEKH